MSPADTPLQGEPSRGAGTSVLQRTALASGLLSRPQLEDALSGLLVDAAGIARDVSQVPDVELADRLVAMGYLNRWQVEQLCEGHTKFRLGPYRIIDAIGKGGMGHVFKGEHELLGRIEAVKVLPRSKSTPEAIAAFHREMRVQAQLDHPNLVRISYADRDGDTYFFVTEYVPGTDLRRLVRRHGPLPATIAASIIAQAAEGLHYAHRRGLVHRDIKPGNLLVTPDGRTKLTDLGLAWFLMDDLEPVAGHKPGTIVGTADYLAPETIAEPDKVRPVSDIYSLGCTFYYAVTGKVPFPGGKSSDKIRRHLSESPLNPLHFNPDLPPEICNLVAQMMQKDPERRLPTAAAVAERLRPWCSGQLPSDLAALVEQTAVEAPRPRPAAATNPALADTAGYEVDDLPEAWAGRGERYGEEVPSQLSHWSQSTDPISAASEDTQDTMTDRLSGASSPEPGDESKRYWPILVLVCVVLTALALFLWGVW